MTKILLVSILMGVPFMNAEASVKKFNYIITETSVPTSLDPLDADQTQNLPVARMIYATPIEIDSQDKLSSQVLESFKYDPNTAEVTFKVKQGAKYSDGKDITPEDVAFAISRMTYTRPRFPVVEYIEGLDKWLKLEEPLKSLPTGINVSKDTVTIKFSQKVKNPLFRFCLELFSIIPKSCVDTKTNKISCAQVPSSGRFVIKSQNSNEIEFKGRFSNEEFKFRYETVSSVQKALQSIETDTILAGNEVMYSHAELNNLKENGKILFLPAARFGIFQINPNVKPFSDKNCRRVMANLFRDEYKNIVKNRGITEASIFTGIVSGYMSHADLEAKSEVKLTSKTIDSCIETLKKSSLQWGYVESEKNSDFVQALTETLKKLGQNNPPLLFKNRKEIAEAFVDSKIAFLGSGSGFWAHDPSGDLQMLFTPNLHKPLNFVTIDDKLQKLIKAAVNNPEDESNYKRVNQYLYDQGLINIYSHVRRFYFTKNQDFLKKSPLGFSAPTVWQVFEL